jgi:hypothetical protein
MTGGDDYASKVARVGTCRCAGKREVEGGKGQVDFGKLKRADSAAVTPWRLLHRFCGVRVHRPRWRLPCPSLHKYGGK